MLVTLIPLFDENMQVQAYSLFCQKRNKFLNTRLLGTGENDGIAQVEGLDVVRRIGAGTLSANKEVFITINSISIFTELEEQRCAPKGRIVFIIDDTVLPEEMYINRLLELKRAGYKLAIRKLPVPKYQEYRPILEIMDYMFFDYKKINIESAKMFFSKMYPQIKLCAGNIDTQENFEMLKNNGGYHFYEGPFYRTPVNKGDTQVSPLKVNYIELLNMVNNEDYELTVAADIISRDTALAIALLKVVNKLARNSEIVSIKYAAAMLGQKELKRWINTVVANKMYSDKPNEITRLSLLRAKFMENLAGYFELAMNGQELFLIGLFSVLDLIMDRTMEKALEIIKVSKDIEEVLINRTGKFAEIYQFMLAYEIADWQEVSRIIVLRNLEEKKVYEAYLNTLEWYRDLFGE